MKLQMYTVYDDAAGAYLQPFFFSTDAQAIRGFTELANDPNHLFGKYASQYTLFNLGFFDQITGTCALLPTPHSLGKAIEFRTVHQHPELPLMGNYEINKDAAQ